MNPLHYLELCRYGLLNTPTVEREMALPAYYGFVRAAAAIGAFVGVLIGLVTMVGGGGIIALIITGFMWMLFSLALSPTGSPNSVALPVYLNQMAGFFLISRLSVRKTMPLSITVPDGYI
jgi:hypothetical protein